MTTQQETKVVEVAGIKLQLQVEHQLEGPYAPYNLGDPVKVLTKEYSETYKSHCGVIIAFDNFEKLPTIVVAYMEQGYGSSGLKFAHINNNSKDIEICKANPEEIALQKSTVIQQLDRDIAAKQEALREVESKKKYVLERFKFWFKESE